MKNRWTFIIIWKGRYNSYDEGIHVNVMYSIILQIIGRALHTIVTGPDLTSRSPSLLSQLVAVHVAYQHSKKEIMWFGQITSHLPGVLVQLGNAIGTKECTILFI